jgi:signal transduction histidine kinase/CheY-like chemotaxis protein/HPt (histidine-containing phosphotransfer) domain-containing protein
MSLRTKILLVLLSLIVSYLGLTYLIQRTLIFPSFEALQSDRADTSVARVEGALQTITATVNAMCTDTAHWDETYDYMRGLSPDYPQINFNHYFYKEADFNLVMIFDREGRVTFEEAYDLEIDEFVPIEDIFAEPFAADDPLIHHMSPESNVTGLILTRRGPLLVASNTILTSESTGPIAGTMLLGRFLDASKITEIREEMDIEFNLLNPANDLPREDRRALRALLASKASGLLHETREDHLVSYRVLRDIRGEPALLLRVEMPRPIAAIGLSAVQLALILLGLAGLLFMATIWIMLQRLVMRPVSSLTDHVSGLRESGDLTRRVQLGREDEIGTLARQFDALTGELEQARQEMAHARDAALEVGRLKGEFLATMSHEIRTPMSGIMGMSDLLLRTPLTDKQQRYADTIQRSADGLLGTLNDILDISKLEARSVELERRDFGLRSLVEEVAQAFAGPAHAKGLELLCAIPLELDAICRGDPSRLRQILVNLLSNAVKFTRRGEVVLEVAAAPAQGGGYAVRFEVRDTGIGISPENSAHIFYPFSQADASTTRQFGGTGLGLAICKRLTELMGGEIGVESRPGVGSTFWLEIPLESSGMGASVWKLAPTSLGGLRALIAYDNPTGRELLERQLSSWEMRWQSVGSGGEVLEALRAAAGRGKPFDLLLLDADMPDIQGGELVRAIRADDSIANISLVMLCSVTSESDLDATDIQRHLVKPVRQSDLFDCMSAVLGHAAGGSGPTREAPENAASGMQIRVLLVEDNAASQDVVMAMLEDMECRVEVVNDGQEALDAMASRHYDVVLMDCQMPVMDGYQATAEIRRREAAESVERGVPIVALTAHAAEGEREKCLEAGMDDYLSKPFRQDALREVLERWSGAPAVGPPERPDAGAAAASGTSRGAGEDGPIDFAALDAIRALESAQQPALLADLIRNHRERAAELTEDLLWALEDADVEGVRKAAHSLETGSGNVGALAVAALCREVEWLVRNGDLARAKAAFDRLVEENARAQETLEAAIT